MWLPKIIKYVWMYLLPWVTEMKAFIKILRYKNLVRQGKKIAVFHGCAENNSEIDILLIQKYTGVFAPKGIKNTPVDKCAYYCNLAGLFTQTWYSYEAQTQQAEVFYWNCPKS